MSKRKYYDVEHLDDTKVNKLYKSSNDRVNKIKNTKRKLLRKYSIIYDPNIIHIEDKLWCQQMVSLLSEVIIIIDNNIKFPYDISSMIVQYACGLIEHCPVIDCIEGEVLILPSDIMHAMNHSYFEPEINHYCNSDDCNIPCFVHPCNSCDSWFLSLKKIQETRDIGHALSGCIACEYINYTCQELCENCYYICDGCGNRFCNRAHKSFECVQCCKEYCNLCFDFMMHGYRLIHQDLQEEHEEEICISCYCDLSKVKKSNVDGNQFHYLYEFDHYKDRFNFWFLIQIIKKCTLIQNMNLDTNLIKLISYYSTGFHFIDEAGKHFVMNSSSDDKMCDSISAKCELSLLHNDIIPYSRQNSFGCMASIISLCGFDQLKILEFNDIFTMQNLYSSGDCSWYAYICDVCHYQIFATKFDMDWDYQDLLYLSSKKEVSLPVVCDHLCHICYIEDKIKIKLCHSHLCSFKCASCQSRQCNKHLVLKCYGCGMCFCQSCVYKHYNHESFVTNCNVCNKKICYFCHTLSDSCIYICKKCHSTISVN